MSRFASQTIATLENMDLERIDFVLVVKVITYICLNMKVSQLFIRLYCGVSCFIDVVSYRVVPCSVVS